jgi:hypothetical protein
MDDLDKKDLTAVKKWFIRHFKCLTCHCLRPMGVFSSSKICGKCLAAAKANDARNQKSLNDGLVKTLADIFKRHGASSDQMKAALLHAEMCGLRDLRPAKVEAYFMLLDTLLSEKSERDPDGRLIDSDFQSLDAAQRILGIADSDEVVIRIEEEPRTSVSASSGSVSPPAPIHLGDVKAHLLKKSRIRAIELGELPVIGSPIPLQKKEVAHFHFSSVLCMQERVVSREYSGGSAGVSFRVSRGVSYRVGSHRGHSVNRSELVSLGSGDLILTSKRLVFSGERAFSIPLLKILHFVPGCDGLEITKDSTAMNNKPFTFVCNDSDSELLNAAFSACFNRAE